MNSIGNRIKELREKLGITTEEFAKEIGLTKSIIWSYELDKKEPSISHLIKISKYFNVSLDYLIQNQKSILDLSSRDTIKRFELVLDDTAINEEEYHELLTYIKVRRLVKAHKY
ncbi:helix-turn-helix domain-containing protein [Bacillus salitolerans]|uniref:Helix-turn-helix domain-containing protein n=1 Tax=Bacillus salitolerans TaxID=1437434 RepID=A0ABW4LJB1_9BACI